MKTRALSVVVAMVMASSCGGGTTPPAAEPTVDVPESGAPMAAMAVHGESRFALANVLPRDTQVLVEVSDMTKAFSMVAGFASMGGDPEIAPLVTPDGWAESFAEAFQMAEGDARALVDALSSGGIAMRHLPARPEVAVVLRFDDASAVHPLLESPRFERLDESHLALKRGDRRGPMAKPLTQLLQGLKADGRGDDTILWLDGPAILTFGMGAYVTDVKRVTDGQSASLVQGAAFASIQSQVPQSALIRAYWDPSMLSSPRIVGDIIAKGWFRSPTPWTAAFDLDQMGSHFTFTGGFSGASVPGPDVVPPPIQGELAALLPEDTWAVVTVSTRSPGGADAVIGWLEQMGKLDPEVRAARDMLFGSGPEASQALSALGKEGALGLVTPSAAVPEVLDGDFMDTSAVVWLQELRNPDVTRQLLHRFLDVATPGKGVKRTADGFEGTKSGMAVFAEVKGDRLFVAAGAPAAVARARAGGRRKGPNLTNNPSFKRAADSLPAAAQVRAWVDTKRVFEVLEAAEGRSAGAVVPANLKAAAASSSSALAITLRAEPGRLDHRIETVNLLGFAAGVGAAGVRRYLASAKTAEAKNTIGAIAREAAAAYESEAMSSGQVTHVLCKGAPDVPSAVPRGEKYAPQTRDGADFETGDDRTGWRCLKFALMQPHYYQYSYRVGGNYKGPKRGGPDPGPYGFEVAAEGDLDGDGKTSLFTRTGVVDPKTKRLTFASQIFVDDEFE